MMKTLLVSMILTLSLQFAVAQDITITYDATKGTTGLVGATGVYMHSGGNDDGVPNDCWSCVIGNWGQDDGIGQLTSVGTDLWEISFNAFDYYSAATGCAFTGTSISCIGMVFRSPDGTAEGKDYNNQDIFVNLSGLTPVVTQADGTPFDGVVATLNTGIQTLNPFTFSVTTYPNPTVDHGMIAYTLNEPGDNINVRLYNQVGAVVQEFDRHNQGSGTYTIHFNAADLSSGVYTYLMTVDGATRAGKLAVVRN